jgi:hypothetical protein
LLSAIDSDPLEACPILIRSNCVLAWCRRSSSTGANWGARVRFGQVDLTFLLAPDLTASCAA